MKCAIYLMGFQRFDTGTECKQNKPLKKCRFALRNPLSEQNIVRGGFIVVHSMEYYNLAGKKTRAPV